MVCDGIISKLEDLTCQLADGCDCPAPSPCCSPACMQLCEIPFAQVCFTCPPCIPLPTNPCPVKPLRMPCPPCPPTCGELIEKVRCAYNSRYDNFYNSYNINDCTPSGGIFCKCRPSDPRPPKRPCEDMMRTKNKKGCCEGCPTGFKPCRMKLSAPPCCNPIAAWKAKIWPCPAKPKKVDIGYQGCPAACCRRPCCKHWKPKEGPCCYDNPCKAHCFAHPPGIKPSGRYP